MNAPDEKKEHKKGKLFKVIFGITSFTEAFTKAIHRKKTPIQSKNTGTHEKKQWATFV
jgi:hypothetical protein